MLLTAYNGAILGPIAKVLGWVMNDLRYFVPVNLQTAEIFKVITEDAA